MSNANQAHPSGQELEKFTLGQLPASEASSLESHLLECPSCCNTLSEFEKVCDPFVSQLRTVYIGVPHSDTDIGAPTVKTPPESEDPYGTLLPSRVVPRATTARPAPSPTSGPSPVEQPAAPSTRLPLEQNRTFGEYDELEMLAQGGMGVVYKARQPSLNRIVALKMIRGDMLGTDDAVRRFYQEARAAAALDHPNIVPIFEVGQHEGNHYFTMAFIAGKRLRDKVGRSKPMEPRDAVELMVPIVDAVAYAHGKGIIHRDLKPDNVLIDSHGRPRVTDFGLAKQIEGEANMTATGAVLGTPSYMAPEQALGEMKKTGPATDIYALGGILYFLLTARPPFVASTVTQVLSKLLTETPAPVRELNPDVPEALSAICAKCLAKQPEQRYTTAYELKESLLDFLRRAACADKPAPRSNRGRHVAALAVAACALLAVGVGWWMAAGGPAPVTEPAPAGPASDGLVPAVATRPAFWPDKQREDFPLKIEIMGGRRGPDSILEFVPDENISLKITSDRDAYLTVWSTDGDGGIVQLFPNEHETGPFKANEPRTLPGPDQDYNITVTPSTSGGADYVRVVASTKQPFQGPAGQKVGAFRVLSEADKGQLLSAMRGLKITSGKASQDLVSETEMQFRVRKTK